MNNDDPYYGMYRFAIKNNRKDIFAMLQSESGEFQELGKKAYYEEYLRCKKQNQELTIDEFSKLFIVDVIDSDEAEAILSSKDEEYSSLKETIIFNIDKIGKSIEG